MMKYNDGILQILSDSFQNAEKRHGTTHWQSVEDKREKKEKKKKKEEKKKKKREVLCLDYSSSCMLVLFTLSCNSKRIR